MKRKKNAREIAMRMDDWGNILGEGDGDNSRKEEGRRGLSIEEEKTSLGVRGEERGEQSRRSMERERS